MSIGKAQMSQKGRFCESKGTFLSDSSCKWIRQKRPLWLILQMSQTETSPLAYSYLTENL